MSAGSCASASDAPSRAQLLCDAPADAGRAAGDDDDLAFESSAHAPIP